MLVISSPPRVKYYEQYSMVGDYLLPEHRHAYIEPPCCNAPDADTGYYSCGCEGKPTIICPAMDCPGIDDDAMELLKERLL